MFTVKKRQAGLVAKSFLFTLLIAAILSMSACAKSCSMGCGIMVKEHELEQKGREAALSEARAKFDQLHSEYMQNYRNWTPTKIERTKEYLEVYAQMGEIDFDPESLPTKPPEGGVSGGSGGGSSGY